MHIQIEKKEPKDGELELTITASFDAQKPVLEKAAKRLSEKKPPKGFRPGKAPYELIEQKYGGEAILAEALEDLIWQTLQQAVKQEELRTVGQPQIEPLKQAYGNDFSYKVVLSLLPELKLGDIDSIKVKKEQPKVEQKEVDKVLDNLRGMRATEVKVDRAAKQGDMVEIDFVGTVDKVALEGGSAKGYKLVLGDKQMIPGFEEEVVGMKAGEEKTFKINFPKDYKQDLAGREAEFNVTVQTVFERKLPELNDEFAKGLGQQDVAGLKKAIQDNLEAESMQKEQQRQELEMLHKLVEATTFGDIPKMLIDNELHRIKHELEYDLTQQGTKFADYLQHLGKKEDEFMKELRPKAEERVKTALIMKQLSEEKNIIPTDEEIDHELSMLKTQYEGNAQAQEQLATAEYREYIHTTLANRKVIEWLRDTILA